jgi:hypothetical protein
MPALLALLIAFAFLSGDAHALSHNQAEGGDACTEKFHECLQGCGPPGSNLGCEKWCEERVLAPCKGGGAAAIKRKGTKKLNVAPEKHE